MKIFIYANIIIVFLITTIFIIFSKFYLVDESNIFQDIKEEYGEKIQIFEQKNLKGSKIILFFVNENESGISNYIRITITGKYYLQKSYKLENLLGTQPIIFCDVFKGTWFSYTVTATPELIKIESSEKFQGIYWLFVCAMYYLLFFEWIFFCILKKSSIKADRTLNVPMD